MNHLTASNNRHRGAHQGAGLSRRAAIACLAALLALGSIPVPLHAGEDAPEGVLDGEVRTLAGPKRTVAVARFASKSDFDFQYGLADVGGGLSALLKAALIESDQFVVVERETLGDVLSEQKLTTSGLVNPEGAALPGQLLGASLLINGAVTEFNESAGGRGFGIGGFGVGLGLKSRKATVGMSIQIVSAHTGQILADYSVREEISSKSVGIDVTKAGINTGYSQFMTTSIGQAARRAITAAVQRFADEVASRPWSGQVVAFDQGEVIINAGSASGIRTGDTFGVERNAQVFTDPGTGRVLGYRTLDMGNVVIDYVDNELAFGTFQPAMNIAPSRGDLVVVR